MPYTAMRHGIKGEKNRKKYIQNITQKFWENYVSKEFGKM